MTPAAIPAAAQSLPLTPPPGKAPPRSGPPCTPPSPLTPAPEIARAFAERMPDGQRLNSDEPQMETTLHQRQMVILQTTLDWHWRDRKDYFLGANLSVYYDKSEMRRRRFVGPDLFLVRGVSPAPRRSWVVWEEGGRYPDLIIELLSESTAQVDRHAKRAHYETIFRTPEYVWFDPETAEFEALRLGAEHVYEPIPPAAGGLRYSQVLGMHLGVHEATLRFYDAAGRLLPTPEESALAAAERAQVETRRADAERERATVEARRADAERERAEVEAQRADAERERAGQLAARLRELGIDPDADAG